MLPDFAGRLPRCLCLVAKRSVVKGVFQVDKQQILRIIAIAPACPLMVARAGRQWNFSPNLPLWAGMTPLRGQPSPCSPCALPHPPQPEWSTEQPAQEAQIPAH